MRKVIGALFIVGFLSLGFGGNVFAGCEVSVSPYEVLIGTSQTFHFTVSNTGSNPVTYVKVPTGLDGAVVVTAAQSDGWDTLSEGGADVFVSGNIAPGSSHIFNISGNTTETPRSFNWRLEASESDGSQSFACNEAFINIEDVLSPTTAPPETPVPTPAPLPGISGITVTANSTTASISWKLDSEATTVVNYGTTTEYGSSASTSGESITLSSLSPGTPYHYEIQVTGAGGTTVITDNSFTTASAGSASITAISTPVITTINSTKTVTKTVILTDTIPPVVQIDTKATKATEKAPKIEGKVVDTGAVNAGISKIQYSSDAGKSWILVSEPNGALKENVSFMPEFTEDGNYPVQIRAIDKSGNIGISSTLLVIIDRLPPRIIHTLWHVGPLIISSDLSGKSEVVSGVPTRLAVQGVGGITEMGLTIGEQAFSLTNNKETGFWETTVLLTHNGEWDAVLKATDGGGTTIEKKIGVIAVSSNSTPLPTKTKSTVWRLDDLTGQFNIWNGEPYSQQNPHEGEGSWFLPPGTYYMSLSAPGYNPAVSTIFTLSKSQAVTIDTKMEKWNIWSLFGIASQFTVNTSTPYKESEKNTLVGKQLPWLEKNGWGGKEVILSTVPYWDPSAASIFTSLSRISNGQTDIQNVVVVPGANASTVDLLKNRGHYNPIFIADPDGDILQDLQGVSLPLTIHVNRKGIVEEVVILK